METHAEERLAISTITAGAIGFEVDPAHGGSVFAGRSSWAM